MGAPEDFFRWNDEVRRLTAQRDRTLDPRARRRLDRQIHGAEGRAFCALRAIARSVRERKDDASTFWDAIAGYTLDVAGEPTPEPGSRASLWYAGGDTQPERACRPDPSRPSAESASRPVG